MSITPGIELDAVLQPPGEKLHTASDIIPPQAGSQVAEAEKEINIQGTGFSEHVYCIRVSNCVRKS